MSKTKALPTDSLSSAEKQDEANRRDPSPSSSPHKDLSLKDLSLPKRPWRLRPEKWERILHYEYDGKGTLEDPFLVDWLHDDAENPMNAPELFNWLVVAFVSIATLAVSLASSAFSGAVEDISKVFGETNQVKLTLGVSLFVLGFALGPLLWAPLSEIYGRRATFLWSYFFLTLWNGVAIASPNLNALLVFRFLAGAFGSSPLTNAGGTVADVFTANNRGLGMSLYSAAPFLGPSLGPITGGFLSITSGWKWVMGFLAIFSGVLGAIGFFILPETYAPVLLRARAAKLSEVTGNVYIPRIDKGKNTGLKHQFSVSLTRPWALLFLEPIVLLLSLYMAIIYATLYSLFSAFPIVFQEGRGWNAGVGGLAFLGVTVGMMGAIAFTVWIENPRYVRKSEASGKPNPPEVRLFSAMWGAPALVIGLAWFSATDSPSIHFIVPIIATVPFGFGLVTLFLSTINYLVDSYVIYAASVLAANSVIRSLFGFGFPLFTPVMYQNVGIHWAPAIAGFLALVCLPFPYLFARYGSKIRDRCRYSKEAAKVLALMQHGSSGKEAEEIDSEIEREVRTDGVDQDRKGIDHVGTNQQRSDDDDADVDDGGNHSHTHSHSTSSDSDHIDIINSRTNG